MRRIQLKDREYYAEFAYGTILENISQKRRFV
jgi:hypothetical protein